MSLKEHVQDIFHKLASGEALEAFDRYYADDVSMRENAGAATVGKAANREREIAFLSSVKEWKSLDVHAIATDGGPDDGVATIEYSFEFINTDDQPVKYEQVAVQRWKDGQIASERFYYDTGS